MQGWVLLVTMHFEFFDTMQIFRCGKRGPLQEGDLQGMAPHEIATSILTLDEEEHADEDDADRARCKKRKGTRPTKRSLKMSNLHGHS